MILEFLVNNNEKEYFHDRVGKFIRFHYKKRAFNECVVMNVENLSVKVGILDIALFRDKEKVNMPGILIGNKAIILDDLETKKGKPEAIIAYLDPESSNDLNNEAPDGLEFKEIGKTYDELRRDAILAHPNVKFYALKSYRDAFNNEEISGLGLIEIIDKLEMMVLLARVERERIRRDYE